MLNSLNDELVITRDIEDRSTGSGVGQLDQWLVTQRILVGKEERANIAIKICNLSKAVALNWRFKNLSNVPEKDATVRIYEYNIVK